MGTITYKSKEYPTRTFMVSDDFSTNTIMVRDDFSVTLATEELYDALTDGNDIENLPSLEENIDENIHYYLSEEEFQLTMEELKEIALDDFIVIEELF